MIKTYLFESIYVRLFNMNFIKILYIIPLMLGSLNSQSIGDLQQDNSVSENYFAVEGSNSMHESIVNIYSNFQIFSCKNISSNSK